MSKKNIQKNIRLSLELDRYISGKPSVLKHVPRGADIIITSDRDKKFSEINLSIARDSRTGQFVEARKSSKGWTIKKI